MTVYVDSDACPVIDEILDVVDNRRIVLVHNRHHEINRQAPNVEVKETGDRQDQADHYIYQQLEPGDLVITDDLGLAALVVGKGGQVLRFRGDVVNEDNVELRLAQRYAAREERQRTKRANGPPAFSKTDREKFVSQLQKIVS